MAQPKKQQDSVGNRNIPAPKPEDRKQEDFSKLVEGVRGIVDRADGIDAGDERVRLLDEAETLLSQARALHPNIHEISNRKVVKTLLKKTLPDEIKAARDRNTNAIDAAARSARDRKKAEDDLEKKIAEEEMEGRFKLGTETDEDKQIMKARKEKELQTKLAERKLVVRKMEIKPIEDALPSVEADIGYGDYDKADAAIIVLESNLPRLETLLAQEEQELARVNIDPAQDPFIIFFSGQIQTLRRSIEKLREKNEGKKQESLQRKSEKGAEAAQKGAQPKAGSPNVKNPVQKNKTDGPESLEELGTRFEGTIAELVARVPVVLALPIGTSEELTAASAALAFLEKDVKACISEYKEKVGVPIIRPLFEKFPNGRDRDVSGKAFTKLDRERSDLQDSFLGSRNKNIEGTCPGRKAELSARRDELQAVKRETTRVVQEARLAEYEQSAAKLEEKIAPIRERMLEVQAKTGDERDVILKEIQVSLTSLKDEWNELREKAPAQVKGDQTVTVRDRIDSAIGCSFSSKGKDVVKKGAIEHELEVMLHGEEKKNKREKWEAEFPAFEMGVATISSQIFDAMMLGGKERKAALELQQTALKSAEEVWQELKTNGPWLSDEDWAAKKFSPVKAMDRNLVEMRERVDELLPNAERAGGMRTDSPNWIGFERDWISSVIRVHQFWNPDSGLGSRVRFLERFICAEMPKDDEEFLKIIPESQREDFLKYIEESNVCKGVIKKVRLEKRTAKQEEERVGKQKQEQRGNLRHPQLNVLRAFEDKMLANFRKAPFWKKHVSERAGDHFIKNGAEMHDEELEKVISDIPAFREAVARLEGIRKDILVIEDVLLRGEDPDSKRDAEGIQRALNGFFQQGRAEQGAWNDALSAEGWTILKKNRSKQLQAIWDAGSLEGVPAVLRVVIERWIQARIRLNEYGEYVQWALDANPDIAKGMNIPKEFRVERSIVDHVVPDDEEGSAMRHLLDDAHKGGKIIGVDPDADPVAEAAARTAGLAALRARRGAAAVLPVAAGASTSLPAATPDAAAAAATSAAPVVDVALVARQEEERKALARKEVIENNWNTVRDAFKDDMFWKDDAIHAGATWAKDLKKFLRLSVGSTMSNDSGLRDDRKVDFYRLAAFTDLNDLLRIFEEIRMSYPVETPVSAAPVVEAAPFRGPLAPLTDAEIAALGPAPAASVSPITMGPPTGSFTVPRRLVPVSRSIRPYIPLPSEPAIQAAPVQSNVPPAEPPTPEVPIQPLPQAPSQPEPIVVRQAEIAPPPQELVSLGGDPYERFFGSRPAPVAAPRPMPRVETPRVGAPRTPMAQPVAETRRAAPMIENTPTLQNPAELRVSGWARSVRETVGKWFGADVADIATREVTGMPSDRERRGEAPSNTEVAYRALGSMLAPIGSYLGFKAFVDVPKYLSQSFCTTNERALLQADILDAIEKNSVAKQRAGSDPEASLRANAEAAARTDRAIATSAYLTDAQKVEMRARVAELQTKYTERTRENVAARSKELANVLENAVQNRVTGWGAAKETANTALRVMAFADVPVGAVRGVTYGVMAFRDRFEKAATKNPEASFVGKVANVFRDTWAETWGKLTKQTNNFRERVTNVGDAMSTIATAVGMAAVTIGSLEEALPGLRMVAGRDAESEGVASLIAEGREKLQAMIDKVLPTYERLAKRTV